MVKALHNEELAHQEIKLYSAPGAGAMNYKHAPGIDSGKLTITGSPRYDRIDLLTNDCITKFRKNMGIFFTYRSSICTSDNITIYKSFDDIHNRLNQLFIWWRRTLEQAAFPLTL